MGASLLHWPELCTLTLALLAGAPEDSAPSTSLVHLAPVITSEDIQCRSISLAGHATEDAIGPIAFRAGYGVDKNCSLELVDTTDGTPIVRLVNNQLLVYNAIENSILYCANAGFSFRLGNVGGNVSQKIGVMWSDEPSKILVDVKSLFSCKAARDSVTSAGPGVYRVSREFEDGKSFFAVVDESRNCPVTHFSVARKNDKAPRLVVDELTVNESIRGQLPQFPSMNRFTGRVRRTDWAKDSPADNEFAIRFFTISLLSRPALRDSSLRQEFEALVGIKIDWVEAANRDRHTSLIIRDVLGIAPKP
jgi:hypothetical protein